ncbi:hypothetical protein TNCV_3979431 [Trichonephila clavipes]|nr:hypothetical protein TNCV_3979431 [Trichonephila clavipes]
MTGKHWSLQARRIRWQTNGRNHQKHDTGDFGRPISRFTVARRLNGGGLFASTSRTVCTFNACTSEKAFFVASGTPGIGETMTGDELLFTDESRFSLSRGSHRILIWRVELRTAIIPRRNIIEGQGTGMRYLRSRLGMTSCLQSVQPFTIFDSQVPVPIVVL